ncbi:hypothetical protein KG088_18535 [Halomonas sp. TRM85114]|uniref:hypothetical protein n=1 Tax=Halomonas jincaotanensis TaxID=2810616 RepID=UPI001BD637C2|nr:hypothetical protein [Halomonas jincaotanensis]MBS9405593.1 hypothetical protein [Halomonas jincaotanensis]
MPITKTIARIVLVMDELLTLAEAHERDELAHYRMLAFSFLTHDTRVSRLMASLGIQCEMRLETLDWLAQELGLPPRTLRQPQPHRNSAHLAGQRVFIGDQDMASDEMNQAVDRAAYSLNFYENLMNASAMPALTPVLTAIIKQKRTEHDVLLEYCDGYKGHLRTAASA